MIPDELTQPAVGTENDNSGDSSPDKETNIDQTQSDDGNIKSDETKIGDDKRLDEHPRWQERERDWRTRFNEQEKKHLGEISSLREEILGRFDKESKTDSIDIPSWFGGDEAQWRDFQKWNSELVSKAKSEALGEITKKSEAEQKRIDEATSFFNSEVETIENDSTLNPNRIKIDRNKLLKTALDFELVDTQGRWNYKAAWQFMKNAQGKSQVSDEKKKIAEATTSEKGAETKKPSFMTSKDFEGKNWGSI